jgi:hypothetical protein
MDHGQLVTEPVASRCLSASPTRPHANARATGIDHAIPASHALGRMVVGGPTAGLRPTTAPSDYSGHVPGEPPSNRRSAANSRWLHASTLRLGHE